MADLKQYVNLDPSKAVELKEIKPERAGRDIKVTANLNKKVSGIPVVFEIISASKNVYPSLDKSNFSKKELVHIKNGLPGLVLPGKAKQRVLTNDDGVAEVDFKLSGFGGDEFKIIAYVNKRGGKKGTELKTENYVVWRRIYYQVSRFKTGQLGSRWSGSLPEIPSFDWGPVKAEYENRQHNIELVEDSGKDLIQRYCNVLVDDADYKKSAKDGYNGGREPVTMRTVLVNMIATPKEEVFKYTVSTGAGAVTISMPEPLWKDESLPLGRDCVIEAKWRFAKNADKSWKNLNMHYIYAVAPYKLRIHFNKLPPADHISIFGSASERIKIKFKVRYLMSSTNGVSWYNAIWLANASMWQGDRGAAAKQSTTIHETGHFIDMVPAQQIKTWYEDKGHVGDHCSQGLSALDKSKPEYTGLNGTCVMFGESASTRKSEFCPECDPSVRKSDVRIKNNMPRNW